MSRKNPKPIGIYLEIAKLVDYDPETGIFTRKKTGKVSGSKMPVGYLSIGGAGTTVYAHRLAWVMHHGELPDCIDHINRERSDNRIENLRSVTHAENLKNQAKRRKRYATQREYKHISMRPNGTYSVVIMCHTLNEAKIIRDGGLKALAASHLAK